MATCHCGWKYEGGDECPACVNTPEFETNLAFFTWAKENNATLPKYLHEAYLDWREVTDEPQP